MPTNDEITANRAAQRLGVDRSTVLRWARDGVLPSRCLPGAKRTALRLFDPADVDAFAEKRIAEAVEALQAMPGVAKVSVTRTKAAAA